MAHLDSIYRKHAAHWLAIYNAVGAIYGSAYQILNFGDQLRAGKVDATAFEARGPVGGTQPADTTWAPNASWFANDTPFDLTEAANWQGHLPVLTLNGIDEEADTPDDGFYTWAAAAFSMVFWVNVASTTSTDLFSKWDSTTSSELREFHFGFLGSGEPGVILYDESANGQIGRNDATAMPLNSWHQLGFSHDGGTSATGIKIYLDGVQVDDTDASSGSFTAIEDLATVPKLASRTGASAVEGFFDGKMLGGPLGPAFVQKELSAAEFVELYSIGAQAAGLG
jgi:hypothetical protein